MPLISGYSSSDNDSDTGGVKPSVTKPLIAQKVVANPLVPITNSNESVIEKPTTETDNSKTFRIGSVISKEAFDESTFERHIRKNHTRFDSDLKKEPKRKKRKGQQFEKEGDGDDVDIDTYVGPWAKFEEENIINEGISVLKEEEEGKDYVDEMNEEVLEGNGDASSSSSEDDNDEIQVDSERTKLYTGSTHDYQNRSYLHPPTSTSTMVNLLNDSYPDICFPPSSIQHTYQGHTTGVTKLLLYPRSQHLLLSSGNDGKIYLWEVYGKRNLIRGYFGHVGAVKDICFNKYGTKFISIGMDKYVKVWDTLTGVCEHKLKLRQRGDVVKFIPDSDNVQQFIVGLHSGKIEQYDLSKKLQRDQLALSYDGHLSSINDLQFFYPTQTSTRQLHLITCSSDKTMKIFTLGNPYPIKQISDPKLQAMTYLKPHPSGKFISAQSMNNTIVTIHTSGKFKFHKPKTFSSHHNVGYNINLDFSPNSQYVISGDANGEVYIWDWQTKVLKKRLGAGMNKDVKQHSKKCITQVVWNRKEVSSLICAGNEGKIYLWG